MFDNSLAKGFSAKMILEFTGPRQSYFDALEMARAARSEIEEGNGKGSGSDGAVRRCCFREITYENRKMKLAGYYEPVARAGMILV